ncbi:MAG TPA: ThiF family adenylyltransferase [Longimicrobium sp.]|jgi:adenylyltransferase/sulfurtransferase|uniref:HesA/MoeB/ThiF family protein n=1 Tax=Longimicrobium sp. TaxID=2029185 RepID=UPI002ED9EF3C
MSRFQIVGEADPDSDPFDRQRRIEWWKQDALTGARVMVMGAGAIGNEVLKNLALLGVGYMFVADFDEVSRSNLSRTVLFRAGDVGRRKAEVAAERTRDLCVDPGAQVDWFHGDIVWDLGAGVFRRMDLVLGCLDNVETRYAVNRLCWLTGTPWIDAGIFELGVRVNVYVPPLPPCHSCGASSEQRKAGRQRYACDAFKRRAYDAGRVATVQVAAALVGALQAQEAVKLLCGKKPAVGAQVYYQGTLHDFEVIPLQVNPECDAHVSFPEVIPVPLGSGATLREFLVYVGHSDRSGEGVVLELDDRSFLADFPCRNCGNLIRFDRPPFRIFDDEALCAPCRSGRPPAPPPEGVVGAKLGRFSLKETPPRLLDLSLEALGIPPLHVVAVRHRRDGHHYYELSGDEARVLPTLARRPSRAEGGPPSGQGPIAGPTEV